jgi:flavin reductase (DIM6/NTAB) family NADH-FMN oxidoreductase RutF
VTPSSELGSAAPGTAAQTVTRDGYRAARGLFATGVTVIGAWDTGGGPRGMTANAFMAVSLDPPLIVVSVRRQARLHGLIGLGASYGVSLLGEAHEREARRFAGMPVDHDKAEARFHTRAGVPVLDGSLAWIAARVIDVHGSGDHTLFASEVTALPKTGLTNPRSAFIARASRESSRGTARSISRSNPGTTSETYGATGRGRSISSL